MGSVHYLRPPAEADRLPALPPPPVLRLKGQEDLFTGTRHAPPPPVCQACGRALSSERSLRKRLGPSCAARERKASRA